MPDADGDGDADEGRVAPNGDQQMVLRIYSPWIFFGAPKLKEWLCQNKKVFNP